MTDCIIPFPDRAAASRESHQHQVMGVRNCLRSLAEEMRDLGLAEVAPILELAVVHIEVLLASGGGRQKT